MRLYPGVISRIAKEIIDYLVRDGDIEVEKKLVEEAELDMSAIMQEYLRLETDLYESAKDTLDNRGLQANELYRMKENLASARNMPTGEEGIEWMINQMLEFLMISQNVEEVFSEDNIMRKKIFSVVKSYLNIDDYLDKEVRKRIKNMDENTPQWRLEYQKHLRMLKKARGYY